MNSDKRDVVIVCFNLCVIAALVVYLFSELREKSKSNSVITRSASDSFPLVARNIEESYSDGVTVTTYSLRLNDASQELFKLQLNSRAPLDIGVTGPVTMKGVRFGEGMLWPSTGAHGSEFLGNLARIHQLSKPALALPAASRPVPLSAVVLGEKMARTPGKVNIVGAGFDPDTTGTWTCTKLAVGEEAAEIFFNFDTSRADCELSLKDSDYGKNLIKSFSLLFTKP